MIFDAMRAARVPWPPNSSITATTILASSAGAKPTNQAWLSSTPFAGRVLRRAGLAGQHHALDLRAAAVPRLAPRRPAPRAAPDICSAVSVKSCVRCGAAVARSPACASMPSVGQRRVEPRHVHHGLRILALSDRQVQSPWRPASSRAARTSRRSTSARSGNRGRLSSRQVDAAGPVERPAATPPAIRRVSPILQAELVEVDVARLLDGLAKRRGAVPRGLPAPKYRLPYW